MEKICVWCGKKFETDSPRRISCYDDHYIPCPDCGTPVKVKNSEYAKYVKNGPARCAKCRIAYTSSVRKNKSAEEKAAILDKRKKTNIERFGTEWASQSATVQAKVVATNQAKYGVSRPLQNNNIYQTMLQNNLKKYGVEQVSQLPEVKAKVSAALQDQSVYDFTIKICFD